jgi:DnaJ-class molecular chaperone
MLVGLFNAISEWKAAHYEKKISKMRSLDKCPDCYGRGIQPMVIGDYSIAEYNCNGCSGTGSFSDWAETTQQPDLI